MTELIDNPPPLPEPRPLTKPMLRELNSIARWGLPGDLADYGDNALAFHAREKVLAALISRGLIADAETITDAGRAAIAKVKGTP